MFAKNRYDEIIKMLEKDGAVTVSALVKLFGVSTETIRRDLAQLESENRLERVHGGAVKLTKMKPYGSYFERMDENYDRKKQIAKVAASMICDGDIVAIDSGSTMMGLTDELKYCGKKIKVVTNFLNAFLSLRGVDGLEPILLGGRYMESEFAFYGALVTDAISRLCFTKMFLTPSSVSLKNGICDYIAELAEVQKAFLQKSDSIIVMADSSKFEKSAFIQISALNSGYTVITDSGLDTGVKSLYLENGIHIYTGTDE